MRLRVWVAAWSLAHFLLGVQGVRMVRQRSSAVERTEPMKEPNAALGDLDTKPNVSAGSVEDVPVVSPAASAAQLATSGTVRAAARGQLKVAALRNELAQLRAENGRLAAASGAAQASTRREVEVLFYVVGLTAIAGVVLLVGALSPSRQASQEVLDLQAQVARLEAEKFELAQELTRAGEASICGVGSSEFRDSFSNSMNMTRVGTYGMMGDDSFALTSEHQEVLLSVPPKAPRVVEAQAAKKGGLLVPDSRPRGDSSASGTASIGGIISMGGHARDGGSLVKGSKKELREAMLKRHNVDRSKPRAVARSFTEEDEAQVAAQSTQQGEGEGEVAEPQAAA